MLFKYFSPPSHSNTTALPLPVFLFISSSALNNTPPALPPISNPYFFAKNLQVLNA